MRDGYNFGGEQSGHLIFLDHATTGDGIFAALQVLAVMLRDGQPLSELARLLRARCRRCCVNVAREREAPARGARRPCQTAIARGRARRSAADGRVLVRYSGTETKARVMVEGPDAKAIDAHADGSPRRCGRR